jgi:hypothetical protein
MLANTTTHCVFLSFEGESDPRLANLSLRDKVLRQHGCGVRSEIHERLVAHDSDNDTLVELPTIGLENNITNLHVGFSFSSLTPLIRG